MTSTTADRATSASVFVVPDYDTLCDLVTNRIAALIHNKPNAVLGLATGSTPLGVYDRLARRHADDGLDFSRVTCFNLDEYYPMDASSPRSYHHFMQENLFSRINCPRWFVPDGQWRGEAEITHACRDYEANIAASGGIDLQLLGIGRSGHIGFNEPGSPPNSRTRRVTLHATTRQDAAAAFGNREDVPTQAVSMGIGTILDAREIILMASGPAKAAIVQSAWSEDVTGHVPASWVRLHSNARLYLDSDAASLLPQKSGVRLAETTG